MQTVARTRIIRPFSEWLEGDVDGHPKPKKHKVRLETVEITEQDAGMNKWWCVRGELGLIVNLVPDPDLVAHDFNPKYMGKTAFKRRRSQDRWEYFYGWTGWFKEKLWNFFLKYILGWDQEKEAAENFMTRQEIADIAEMKRENSMRKLELY
jgi:hypothetical protein